MRDIGLKAGADSDVWNHAKVNDFVVVSKDSDMHDLSLALGLPPKVIWLRLGNCSTRQVAELLLKEFGLIELFHRDDSASLLVLP